ncbi:ABC transporter ATP-binding protein/permease [Alphaproteobacteria bacterium]|nr:ABC transporter ATP-binding protein/permease [Alphaproteobacteria bacterium]
METISFGSVIAYIGIITNPDAVFSKLNIPYLNDFYANVDKKELIFLSSFALFILFLFRNVYLGFINFFSRKFIYNIVVFNTEKLFYFYINSPLKLHFKKKPEILTRNLEQLMFAVCERIFYFSVILRELLIFIVIISAIFLFNTLITTIVFLILMLVSFIFIRILKKSLKKRSIIAHQHDVSRLKMINEFYFNLKEIKLYNLGSKVLSQFMKSLKGVESHRVFFNTVNALPRLFLEIIALAGILFIVITSNILGLDSEQIITIITVVAICASRMIPGFQQISTAMNVLNNTKFAIDIIQDDINNFIKKHNLLKISANKNFVFKSFEMNNCSFSYFQDIDVLKNINLKINSGDKICIIGESGSGKSTLLTIIMGLLSPNNGKIEINNDHLDNQNLFDYQSQIGYVAQDVFLLDDTIINNIALGQEKEEIDSNRIEKIIKILNLDKLINNSEMGLQTLVGTKGSRLSGGQIQRIGIARALYKQPKVIFFDEATSSLDEINEKQIMDSIFNLFANNTIIFVTHKKSLKDYFNRTIVIDNGEIVQDTLN